MFKVVEVYYYQEIAIITITNANREPKNIINTNNV